MCTCERLRVFLPVGPVHSCSRKRCRVGMRVGVGARLTPTLTLTLTLTLTCGLTPNPCNLHQTLTLILIFPLR